MKYVRTERGIYKLSDYKKIEDGWLYFVVDGVKTNIYGKVISQADAIEELCDEFVLFRDGKPYAILRNEDDNATKLKETWKDYRGAIWTDKGLIYVAKMNDKGEWELL